MQLIERGQVGLDDPLHGTYLNSTPGKRSTGSQSWGGINNTHFWLHPSRQIGGILPMQFLPFVDAAALDALDTFERGTIRTRGPLTLFVFPLDPVTTSFVYRINIASP
jgi:hypothetical protein